MLLDIKAHKSKIVFLGDPPSLLGQSLDDEESKIMPEPQILSVRPQCKLCVWLVTLHHENQGRHYPLLSTGL